MSKKGYKQSEEHKKKMSDNQKGEKAANWKGGISMNYKRKNAPYPKPEQCEICGTFGKDLKVGLSYDHNHQTGQFRGWLCGRCNIAIGMVKDNTEILLAMIEYLKR